MFMCFRAAIDSEKVSAELFLTLIKSRLSPQSYNLGPTRAAGRFNVSFSLPRRALYFIRHSSAVCRLGSRELVRDRMGATNKASCVPWDGVPPTDFPATQNRILFFADRTLPRAPGSSSLPSVPRLDGLHCIYYGS